ncbi:MAG: sulfatase [Akkermansiaceae bacterium]|nr:sulfatase [Akkermansiaceae bacterium]
MKLNQILFASLSIAAGMLQASAADASAKKLNVLFIAVDDLRPELGCYGFDYIKSPNIDRIAKKGVVFNRAYVQQSVCSPSRSSVMTGLRPDSTKVWDLVTHFRTAQPDAVTLQQNFKNHGYFVQGMGKIFHGKLDDKPSWSVPWQVPDAPIYTLAENQLKSEGNVQGEPDATPAASNDKPKKAKKSKKASASEDGKSKGSYYECADVPDNTYQDGKVAELAVKTLGEVSKKSEPFFLAVGFIKPHMPFVSPKKYWDLYDPSKITLAPNPFLPKGAPDYAINPNDGEIRAYKGVPPQGAFPEALARNFKHAYYAGISYTDAQIGKVLDELDRLGLSDNTIVILWGDHGWKLGEHSAWGKHTNVENDTNAPLIISVPGMKTAGKRTNALVEFVDMYPTLSELAGLPIPASIEGTSFKPLLEDLTCPWKSAAFSQYPRGAALMGYSMRTDKYRFTVWVDRKDHSKVDATELYDHEVDPQENTNIANEPANAALVAKLMEQWNKGWQGAKPAAAH